MEFSLGFAQQREMASRHGQRGHEISFITGFPQTVDFLEEKPALSLPFLEIKLIKLV